MGRHTRQAMREAKASQLESPDVDLPLYVRMLGLRHISPGPFACFFLFEGVIGVALLLALAGYVSWWGVLVIPVTAGAMVKVNDIVAGRIARVREKRASSS